MTESTIGRCNALDGPLVTLARKALETQDVNHVLPWLPAEDEEEIRRAFGHALAVRRTGPDARDLADTHFFETVVRAHRAAEGLPYNGIMPAQADTCPAVPMAALALESGHTKGLVNLLINAVRSGVHGHLQPALERRNFAVEDIAAGRAYVAAYELYIQYVEQLWEAATRAGTPAASAPDRAASVYTIRSSGN